MIEFILSLLLQFSVLQSGGVKTPISVNEKKATTTTTQSKAAAATTTTDPGTGGGSIGSGGWDDRD